MGHTSKFSLEVAFTQVFTTVIEADTLEEAEKIARTIQLNSEGDIVKSKYDSKIESFDRIGSKIILANDANTDAFNTEPTGEDYEENPFLLSTEELQRTEDTIRKGWRR